MIIGNQKSRGVLIIDDDKAIRDSIVRYLQSSGFEKVFSAEDAMRAMTCLELDGDSIYVVVTDIVMPGMDGRKLAEFLTANYHKPTGIIYMSGFHNRSKEFTPGTFNNGEILDFDFLNKPFNFNELLNRVLQCGDLVYNRRVNLSRYSIENISIRMDLTDKKIDTIAKQIEKIDSRFSKKSLVEALGFEVLKAICIAAFIVIAFYSFNMTGIVVKSIGDSNGTSAPGLPPSGGATATLHSRPTSTPIAAQKTPVPSP